MRVLRSMTHLLCDQLADLGIAMPQRRHSDAGGEIQVLPVLNIPEVRTLAPDEDGGRSGVGGHHVLCMLVDQRGARGIGSGVWVGETCFPLQ